MPAGEPYGAFCARAQQYMAQDRVLLQTPGRPVDGQQAMEMPHPTRAETRSSREAEAHLLQPTTAIAQRLPILSVGLLQQQSYRVAANQYNQFGCMAAALCSHQSRQDTMRLPPGHYKHGGTSTTSYAAYIAFAAASGINQSQCS